MQSLVIKLILATCIQAFLFINIVACGSLNYQVLVDEEPLEASSSSSLHGIHADLGWTKLPINIYFGENIDPNNRQALENAMQSWEKATGRELFQIIGTHQGVNGDGFQDLYSSLDDQVNGYYRDENWSKTNKPQEVLGTTIWLNDDQGRAIETADIRFNYQTYNIGNSLKLEKEDHREVVDMETLALHEMGHLLGLSHISSAEDRYSIMNPALYIGERLASRNLSEGDVERVRKIYGCHIPEKC